jgi:hypothetical protein
VAPQYRRAAARFAALVSIVLGAELGAAGPVLGQTAAPPPATATPAPTPKPSWATRGLTLSIGSGYAYGLIGVQARFDIPIKLWLRVAPFVGAGTLGTWVGATGMSASLGFRHRLAADLAVCPFASQPLVLHGSKVDQRVAYGPAVAGGYEYSSGVFLFRVLFGYHWGLWTKGADVSLSDVTLLAAIGGRLGGNRW